MVILDTDADLEAIPEIDTDHIGIQGAILWIMMVFLLDNMKYYIF